jgi:hypothetical protein
MCNSTPSPDTQLSHFAYVTPLREEEFGDLLRRFGSGQPGWALVDGSAQLWGWHWVDTEGRPMGHCARGPALIRR